MRLQEKNDYAYPDGSGEMAKDESYILVVDDNEDMRMYLKNLLLNLYNVKVAADGKEALKIIGEMKPILVITDVMMPRLDGIGLLKEIRKDPSMVTLPVVMLSANAGEQTKIEGLSAGADDYLAKPFSAHDLLAVIDKNIALSKVQTEISSKLQNEREKIVKLFLQAPVAMAILKGPTHRYELANREYLEVVRKTADEIIGKDLAEVLPELKEQGIISLFDKIYQTGEPFYGNEVEIELIRNGNKSPAYFNLVYQPYYEDKVIRGVMAIGYEVTDLVAARNATRENELMYRELIRDLPAAIYTCDSEGRIKIYNEAAVAIWGREPEPGVDQWCGSWKLFKTNGEPLLKENCPMAVTLKTGKPVNGEEIIIERPDGSRRNVRPHPRPLFDITGKISGAVNMLLDVTGQKKTEEDLAKLAAIVQSSDDAIISKNLEGIVSSWNGAAEKMFGYTAEEMIGQPILKLLPADRLDEEVEILGRLKRGEGIEHFETKRVTKDKRILDISLTISPVRDSQNNIIGASKIARDITKQKQINLLMKESEERFRLVANSAPVMIWISDTEKLCTFFNKGWFDFTGRTFDQEKGMGWTEGIHKDDLEYTLSMYATYFDRRDDFHLETRFRRKDEEYRWVSVYAKPFYDVDGSFRGYIGAGVDIQEQKETKQELEKRVSQRTLELVQKNKELLEQKNFVETILDSSVDVIAVLDRNLNYVAINRKASEIYEREGRGIVGENILNVFPQLKGSVFYEHLIKALEGETIHDKSYYSPITGKTFENFFIPLKQGGAKPEEILLIGHDISENVRASEKIKSTNELLEKKNLELEQSNNELASFSYVASHDLQEPLRKIRIFGKMIIEQESEKISETGKDYLQRMINASDRMQNLIEALLEFSRTNTSSKSLEKKDINDLMNEVEKELHERIVEKKAKIIVGELPELYVIPFQFTQMMVNIVNNAIKYAKENIPPVIHVTSDMVPAEMIDNPDVVVGMDYCRITVKDNGIGFEPQYAQRIFELFQRLHGWNEYAGSGIGLAICKKIAKNHNGFIIADSVPDVGTSIQVFIPC